LDFVEVEGETFLAIDPVIDAMVLDLQGSDSRHRLRAASRPRFSIFVGLHPRPRDDPRGFSRIADSLNIFS